MVTLRLRQLRVLPGRQALLEEVSWQEFELILEELGESRAAQVAYDRETLEIMTPLPEHEHFKEVMGDLIKDIAETLDQDYESYGSTTWRRESKMAGVEADNCFYFQNERSIRGKLHLDLNQDPPPDLALEIDVTSRSLSRFPIYARLGVPELWCYEQGRLKIYHLQTEKYVESEKSLAFPTLPIHQLPSLIEQYRDGGRRAIRQAVKAWAGSHRSPL